jgi:Tol biopolymer transport system component
MLRWVLHPGRTLKTCLCVGFALGVALGKTGLPESGGAKGLPLEPERTIQFTTDQGTWMSLDVSPDGKTIVFDLLGHLYTVPVQGGVARRITSGMAFDSQPRYSPDGSKIAFVSDRSGASNLWVVSTDGSETFQITKEDRTMFVSPVWAKNGEYVFVSRKKPYYYKSSFELWMYDTKGGSGIAVRGSKPESNASPETFDNALGAALSSDGRYVYYAQKMGVSNSSIEFPYWQIVRRDCSTGSEETITQEQGSAMRPAISPDGVTLIYATRRDSKTGLRIRNLTTGRTRWLKYPVDRDDQESYFSSRDLLPGFSFTPDGGDVIVAFGGKIHRLSTATGEDEIIPCVIPVNREVGPSLDFPDRVEDGPVRARLIKDPVLLDDDKEIVFTAFAQLYRMRISDRKVSRITAQGVWEFNPAASPDGKWLAFVTWTDRGGDLWKIRSDGVGEAQRLSRISEYYSDPVWSPDGSKIFALRMPWQDRLEMHDDLAEFHNFVNQDLIWISSSGGEEHIVASAGGARHLEFSREADRIYFTLPGPENSELVSTRFDGTDKKVVLRVTSKRIDGSEPTRNTQIVLSPDGQSVLILFRYQIFVAHMPPTLGQPPTIDISSPAIPLSRLSGRGADSIGWADSGSTITWTLGATFYRRSLATVQFTDKRNTSETSAAARPGDGCSEAQTQSEAEVQSVSCSDLTEQIPVIVERPRYVPKGTIVLRGARVITMRGDEVIAKADVVVTGNRIASVSKTGTLDIPAHARIIDLSGATIIPGFIDTHDHWNSIRHDVLEQLNWDFLTDLAYGVTTGRDPQTQTNDIFAYQDLEETGTILSPRLFSTGPGIFWTSEIRSFEDALDIITRYKRFYRTHTIKSYLVGNREQRQWMAEASRRLQMMPTTEGMSDMSLDLTHFIDGFSNEHNLPIVPLYQDVIEMIAQSHSFYNPTLLMTYGGPAGTSYFIQTENPADDPKVRRFYPRDYLDRETRRMSMWVRKDEYDFPDVAEATAKIIHAGGKVSLGSHGNFAGLGFQWALWALAGGGLTPLEVLHVATINGAECLGYRQDLGSIEAGKLADVVVLKRDPLKDIHNTASIRYVMKNGVLLDGDTLNEVWPEQKPLGPTWWSDIEQ